MTQQAPGGLTVGDGGAGALPRDATPRDALIERVVRRDRMTVAAGVLGIAVLAWAHLLRMARHDAAMGTGMPGMHGDVGPGMAMPHLQAWGAAELALLVAMWAVMMTAMMLPSAAPLVLLFATITRRRRARQSPAAPTGALATGYLLAWTAFSVVAALAQWGLHQAALLSPAMASTSPTLAGLLLIGAGLYQWTPLKGRCLAECRSPLGFLTREWREGTGGALVMGARHGAFCVGCCWVLMALLFVAGVMNLLWVAGIAAFVLVEKAAPAGGPLGKIAGVLLVGWGGWVLVAGG
jgi:predicted metal-binding membrane protein